MTKLSELAGATKLRGAVCITDAKGVTHRYETEAMAFEAWRNRIHLLEHRRGAFFAKPASSVDFDFRDKPLDVSEDPLRERAAETELTADEGRRRKRK